MAEKDKYQWYNYLASLTTKELEDALEVAKKFPVLCSEGIQKITIVLNDRWD